MRRVLFVLGLAVVGCDAGSQQPKFAAPVDDGGTARGASVIAARPEKSDPKAEAVVGELLVKHTKGEPRKVEGLRAHTLARAGKWTDAAGTVDATVKTVMQWPDLFRGEMTFAGRGPHPLIMASRGGTGWIVNKNQGIDAPRPLDAVMMDATIGDTRAEWMLTLVPLLDPSHRVALAPEFDAPGVVAVRAWVFDHPPVVLSIDTKSGLLSKVRYEARQSGLQVSMELTAADHQFTDGVFLPGKVAFLAGGKTIGDWAKVAYTFPAAIDPDVFNKP